MAGLKHPVTPDGRYFVVRGKLWRMNDPNLEPRERSRLVNELMAARRSVKQAKAAGDKDGENAAHRLVDEAKRGLGECAPVWGEDDAPASNRHAGNNLPPPEWY